MVDRDHTDAPSSSSSPIPSPKCSSSSAKKRVMSSGGSGSGYKSNKMMKSIITEQPRIQLKHYHVESFWNKVAAEMNENPPGMTF